MIEAIDRGAGFHRYSGAKSLIALRRVSRIHDGGAIVALKNVDLQIREGDCVAIVGASGSGKSSLINILCGIDYSTSGHVIWEGRAVRRRRDWAWLRRLRIGIVFQEFNLIPTLTALENVELALFGRGLSPKHRYTRAGMVLGRVGLDHRPHRLVTRLSGGERQRVAIARSIVNEPKLILADEPTGNLDSENRELIADLMLGLQRATGATLVLVTHDESLGRRCRRCIRVKDGTIVEDRARFATEPPRAAETAG